MPSFSHESLAALFRERPALAAELLRRAGADIPGEIMPRLTSAEFSDLDRPEYRADAVVCLDAANEKPVGVVIVEVQLERDAGKRFTWPHYMTGVRVRFRCSATLLVVALDDSIAAWCAQPIQIDRNGSVIRPLVLGPREIPRILDPEEARALPELAILSAVAHGRDEPPEEVAQAADAALIACAGLDSPRSTRYADLIMTSLGEPARRILEALMNLHKHEYQSEFAKRYVQEGRTEGRAEGLREVLLEQLTQRFGDIPDPVRERIEHAELADLEHWTKRVIPAASLADVFDAK